MNPDSVAARAAELDAAQRQARYARVDRAFAVLLVIQWVAGIAAALWLSPYAWAGKEKVLHVHLWIALLGGAGVTLLPVLLAIFRPVVRIGVGQREP